ncbi:MAG: ATP-binding cassette domain-containing protein [Desulfuromonadales bacterium]|nr:ATP-binding cassette domain-containing protein [Desulfuromonadales bacterium]
MTRKDTFILSAQNLHKQFKLTSPAKKGAALIALDDVSLDLATGESLGIAGESGCGKTTLGKILAGLMKPDYGSVDFQGTPLSSLSPDDYRRFRCTTQMIFQDPFSSLNPRMRIADIIAEPLVISGMTSSNLRTSVAQLMETVGLSPELAQRFPDEFSGGQRQRIGIARALAASPHILIADEPVSSLDISIQAQIINLLQEMKTGFNLSLVIISHNLAVLRHMCDRVIIMYLGIIVEQGPASDIFRQCLHPYTEALIAAIPKIAADNRPAAVILTGDLPSPLAIPSGCRFHPRCRYAEDLCRNEVPELKEIVDNHSSACHFATRIFSPVTD